MIVENSTDTFQHWQETATVYLEKDNRLTQIRLRIKIPKSYHKEPVVSQLIAQHSLIVNITAAQLGANTEYDGLFELELQGTAQQIQSALIYLNDLDLEIWYESHELQDGW
jgi:ABC-type methionine transport system ATPase subunit